MREIVLDTETTGLDPATGHRVVEIGCIELLNHVPTGEVWHAYLNPKREMPQEAFAVHGLGDEFLAGQPRFAERVDELLTFLQADRLVIHNAAFDLRFLNAELNRLGLPPIESGRAVDTVAMARRRFPGAPASLDALCKRFGVDNSQRTRHGALLDAELLAEVYLELLGGRQTHLGLAASGDDDRGIGGTEAPRRPPRPHAASPAEAAAHAAFLEKAVKDPIWLR